MIFKILSGIIIVFGFGYGGFLYSENLKRRIKRLEELCDGLHMLEFNIRYMNSPLQEAFFGAGKSCGGVVGDMFLRCGDMLKNDRGLSPCDAFCMAVDENLKEMHISQDDVEILKSFAKALGEGDIESEINNIKTARLRLFSAGEDSKEETLRKIKMSRSMGFLLGLFIVIVLI